MFATDDTIVAIATPHGRGGIGVVRLSGPAAGAIAQALVGRTRAFRPRRATFARLAGGTLAAGATGHVADHVVVTHFPEPASYTGQDVTEISAHGSPVVLRGILQAATAAGARLAAPGEFTLRAHLNGKVDLVQAEAVADLINAATPLQARTAFDQLEGTLTGCIRGIEATLFDLIARLEASLDFPDEGYHFVDAITTAQEIAAVRDRLEALVRTAARGRIVREGLHVVILGTPNAGKSSLFNALVNAHRAIVTAIPGTTRDLLSEQAEIEGLSVTLVDTAGIRDTDDEVEREGVARARGAASVADLRLVVIDGSRPLDVADRALLDTPAPRVIVVSKCDLPAAWPREALYTESVEVSALTGSGLDRLAAHLSLTLSAEDAARDVPMVTNVRHVALLERARTRLETGLAALADTRGAIPEEFLLADLQEASTSLQEITGQRTTDQLLEHIFSSFCVGK
jgi:tRNA modification GTPase